MFISWNQIQLISNIETNCIPKAHPELVLEYRMQFLISKACMHTGSVTLLSPLQSVWPFATLWTVAHHAPLSMGFSKQECWSGLPSLLQGIFNKQ